MDKKFNISYEKVKRSLDERHKKAHGKLNESFRYSCNPLQIVKDAKKSQLISQVLFNM